MLKRIAILALLGVSLASAKTYSFVVSEPTNAGQAQLKPGEYSLKLDGSQVVLKDMTGRQIDVTAKVEPADRKFDETAVQQARRRTARIESSGSNLGAARTRWSSNNLLHLRAAAPSSGSAAP